MDGLPTFWYAASMHEVNVTNQLRRVRAAHFLHPRRLAYAVLEVLKDAPSSESFDSLFSLACSVEVPSSALLSKAKSTFAFYWRLWIV